LTQTELLETFELPPNPFDVTTMAAKQETLVAEFEARLSHLRPPMPEDPTTSSSVVDEQSIEAANEARDRQTATLRVHADDAQRWARHLGDE
jgi:hypothetical protein